MTLGKTSLISAIVVCITLICCQLDGAERPRVIVSTDIGGSDPDDFQSMVHYLVYADVFDTEGLISSPPHKGRVRDILECIAAYEKDYDHLHSWSPNYPSPDALREVIRQGAVEPQSGEEPDAQISDGAKLIIERVNLKDTRPLYVLVWGSITDVAQAVHKDPSIKAKLRIHSIGSWNTRQDPKARDYLFREHPDLWWIESDTTFRGMYMGGAQDGDLGNQSFTEKHVKEHGHLGMLFMQKKADIKMGDTPSVLYLLYGDPDKPTTEHWGGAFVQPFPETRPHYWHDNPDKSLTYKGKQGAKTVSKWRQAFLLDWKLRMDRTVTKKLTEEGRANTSETTLAEGHSGIAAHYPGDIGIGKDSNVIFVETFNEESLDRVLQRWEEVKNQPIMALSTDSPQESGNQRSLLLTHIGGTDTGGHLYRRLTPGYKKLFFRFYTKIDPASYPIHHFVHFGGYNPATRWALGGAGVRPLGDRRFTIGIEPHGKRWVWDYYTYWMDMRGSPPRGQTWGNSFIRNDDLKVQRGKWTALEVMVDLNQVGDSNGELALWIDGRLVSHLGKGFPKGKWIFDKFMPSQGGEGIRWNDTMGGAERFFVPEGGVPFEGFRWRETEELNINFIWMLLYITKAPEGHVSRVWFDNIVVAKQYIGPIKPHSIK